MASPRREGSASGRFEVQAEDRWRGTERAEIVRSDTIETAGTVRWYGWSTYFAPDFAPPEGMWQVFTQWHHLGDTGSPSIQRSSSRSSGRRAIQPRGSRGGQALEALLLEATRGDLSCSRSCRGQCFTGRRITIR